MAVRFPEGFALTLFVLSRLILDHWTIVGCWPCSLPWQSWVVCSCVLFAAVSPLPSVSSGSLGLSRTLTALLALARTPARSLLQTQTTRLSTPFACFHSSLHSPAAYTIIITQLLMDHLMFISLIRMEAPLGITLLWFTACSIPSVHSPGT